MSSTDAMLKALAGGRPGLDRYGLRGKLAARGVRWVEYGEAPDAAR